jgi:hypothetical protein
MDKHAFFYGDFACWHMPALGGSGLQHRLCGGCSIAELSPGICNRSRPACALNSAESEIVIARRISRRELGANLGPIGIELIGNNCRESRRDALPFVEMFDDHGHAIISGDSDKRVRLRGILRRRGSSDIANFWSRSDDKRPRDNSRGL